ncbi:MAG: helix-turn-helix transcriptional regulator [Parafilimonas sp.]|nr:helix-turn-helix transcriptional regulator [Parafilimonas sp.]
MKSLKAKFFGESKKQFQVNGLTIVDSIFNNYENCPWHYHQHAHFAFTTKGNLTETHKKQKLQLQAGCLLYNHSQEPHCNGNYSSVVSALHIDIDANWFKKYDINSLAIEGVSQIQNPVIKNIFCNILKEVKLFDINSPVVIESLVMQALHEMTKSNAQRSSAKPAWVFKLKDLLYDQYSEKFTLKQIAEQLNLHPVHLCQQFPFYFGCSLGDYIRKIKIEKSVTIIFKKNYSSLTQVAYECGFADQSHFIKIFKKNIGITPFAFQKLIT